MYSNGIYNTFQGYNNDMGKRYDEWYKDKFGMYPPGSASDRQSRGTDPGYTRWYQQNIIDMVYDAYGNKCKCCGIARRSFLQIDHINDDGKAWRQKHKVSGGFTTCWKIWQLGFPKGVVQILCANCHQEKTQIGECLCSGFATVNG